MALPPFIHLWIFITALLVQVLYAQNIDVLASQPVIHGEINGMKVMAQGDAVAFFAAGKPSLLLGDEECAHDLSCTMQKNRTEAVVFNPEGVWLFETPKMYAPENVTITEPLSPVSTEQFFSAGTFIKPTPIHIPLAFPQPTATLHTGNEVVDKTPGILLVSSLVREWLAETISTSSLVEEMPTGNAAETLSPIIEPTPLQQRIMLTTISQEEDELIRKLTSTATTPVPTPVPTLVVNRMWEDGLIRLEVGADILTIKPSPSGQYDSSETTSSFTFSVKQVPTETGDPVKTTGANESEASTSEMQAGATAGLLEETPVASSEAKEAAEEEISALLANMEKLDFPESPSAELALEESEVRQKTETATQKQMTREGLQKLMTRAIDEGNTEMIIGVAEDILRCWESTINWEERTHLLRPDLAVSKPASELTYEEMRRMIERMGDDSYGFFSNTNKASLLALLNTCKEDDSLEYMQMKFEKDAPELISLSRWRTVPEYTADEKRKLLAKDKIDGYGVIETLIKTAERIAKLNKMTDVEIHNKYSDLDIHEAMKVDAGLVRPPLTFSLGRFLLHDYSAEEKKVIVIEHHRLFPDGADTPTFSKPLDKVTDLEVHRVYSDEWIRKMKEECTQKQQ